MLLAFAFSVPIAALGAMIESPRLVSIALVILGCVFVFDKIRADGMLGVTPAVMFAVFSGVITGFANFIGLSALETKDEGVFFLYAEYDFLLAASLVAYGGALFSLVGMNAALFGGLPRALPRVEGSFSQSTVNHVVPFAALGLLFSVGLVRSLALGTIGALLLMVPNLAVFLLAFSGWRRAKKSQVRAALFLATAVATHALFFAYLRSAMLIPILAFSSGCVLGARSLRPLRSAVMLPIYGAGLAFVAVFKAFGQLRTTMGAGADRIETLRTAEAGGTWESVLAFVSRLTSFNQLSQVANLTERDGFYGGETLEYLGYAFIPRVLWPEKPVIAKGQWFAFQIGRAWEIETGRYTNSINMTIPGELYLNFGWLGLAVGCFAVGAYFMLVWRATRFWARDDNHLGQALGFYLLFIAMSLGADLQMLVTLTAMYALFALASFWMRRSEPIVQVQL